MLKTVLTFIHLGSFALSFGLVLFCDVILSRLPRTGRITQQQFDLLQLASRFIFKSLWVLILSGMGFLVYYFWESPQLLENPKLYAKMFVVTALAINGYWLHVCGLPLVHRGILNDLSSPEELLNLRKILISGALSTMSWWTAFAFGVFRELNFKFSFAVLLGAYGILLAGCLGAISLYIRYLNWRANAKTHVQVNLIPEFSMTNQDVQLGQN